MNIFSVRTGARRHAGRDHDELQVLLGPYVLGALGESESRQVSGHLPECSACRQEYGELLEVRSVLDRVGEMAVLEPMFAADASSEPPEDRGSEPVRAGKPVRDRRPHSRRRRLGLAAGTAVLVGAVGVGSALLAGNQSGAPTTRTVTATGLYGITAVVRFHPEAWGTSIQLRMSNVPAGYTCTLTAVGRDGRAEVAATWSPGPGPGDGTVPVPGAVAIPAASIDHFDVAVAPGIELVVPAR